MVNEDTARASSVVAKEETGTMNEESPKELAPLIRKNLIDNLQPKSKRACVWVYGSASWSGSGCKHAHACVCVHQIHHYHIRTL